MIITTGYKIGLVEAGKVSEYRRQPSNINLAVSAAAHSAMKNGQRVIVIEGNSYMNKVYHIARENDSVSKFLGMSRPVNVLIVEPTGECFYGVAE